MWINGEIIMKMEILNQTQPIDIGALHMKQQYATGYEYFCHIVEKYKNAITADIKQS